MKLSIFALATALSTNPKLQVNLDSPSRPSAPGAGSNPLTGKDDAAIVRKDGFYHVKCMHDGTHIHADNQSAQGQKRYAAQNSDVSVIWYDETVASEDRVDMTPRVCFDFCRVQDRMGFFGLIHGRDCYCTPYYRSEAGGENEDCDLPCPGEQSSMCGGKHKSDVYSMHFCNNIDADLTKAKDGAKKEVDDIKDMIAGGGNYARCKGWLQDFGSNVQDCLGHIGATAESDAMQTAKERSGELERLFEAGQKLVDQHDVIMSSASNGSAIEKQQAQEMQVIDLQKFRNQAAEFYDETSQILAQTCDSASKEGYEILNEYRHIWYFDTKKRNFDEDLYSTCEGEIIGKPRYQTSEGCALACSNTTFPDKCEGFSIMDADSTNSGMCILYSKVTAGNVWDCEHEMFLQTKKKKGSTVQCFYRLSDATGFAPNISKKNHCN